MYFSKVEFLSGYFQMAIEEDSQNLTASTSPPGLYKWKGIPMGLASAPSAFQNLMELVFAGLFHEMARVFLNDVIVFERNFDEHWKQLDVFFQCLAKNELKIKGSKGIFFQKRVSFLGHIISQNGVKVEPEKIRAVESIKYR